MNKEKIEWGDNNMVALLIPFREDPDLRGGRARHTRDDGIWRRASRKGISKAS